MFSGPSPDILPTGSIKINMSTICLFNFRRSGFALHIKFMTVAGIGENKSKSFEIVIVIVQNIFLLVMVNFRSL